MKALIFNGKTAEYRENVPIPEPADGQSLIRVLLANVCSTDREILKGYRPDFTGIMGHEFVGEVVESGDASLVGRLVVGELNEGCGHCLYCRTGREKHCLDRRVIGMSKDGCFAEYMTLATHLLHVVPEGLPPEKAVFAEPLAAALEITEQVKIDPSLNAAVIGDGRLGFMCAQVLVLTGVDLTVIGHHPDKLKMFKPYAKTRLASDYTLTAPAGEAVSACSGVPGETVSAGSGVPGCGAVLPVYRDLTADECFEYVVEASGAPGGFDLAMNIVRKMGTIILKSTYAGKKELDMSLIPVNEIKVVGSRCGPFEPALKLLAEGKVSFPDVELYDLKDWQKAFGSGAFKAGFDFR